MDVSISLMEAIESKKEKNSYKSLNLMLRIKSNNYMSYMIYTETHANLHELYEYYINFTLKLYLLHRVGILVEESVSKWWQREKKSLTL